MNEKFNDMTLEKLEAELAEKKDLLDEVMEERKFWLCNTSVHVPGHKVRQYEAEIKAITESIEEIEHEIKKKKI